MQSQKTTRKNTKEKAIEDIRAWKKDAIETLYVMDFDKDGAYGTLVRQECAEQLEEIFQNLETRISDQWRS